MSRVRGTVPRSFPMGGGMRHGNPSRITRTTALVEDEIEGCVGTFGSHGRLATDGAGTALDQNVGMNRRSLPLACIGAVQEGWSAVAK